ncbi:zinc finger C2HC domain-containing protein 1C isoform X2 [Leptidea sinapis]|uniref:zinc finger C2HC domain-containing protein 1C isoform X2 n=1 Tax=Leptidea sinapis TaxID=189913 RepID=UPI0021C2BFF5|nr:zinc finger C2HC domain-containing protein 1C isoform X2 [Leptidea sinapis]
MEKTGGSRLLQMQARYQQKQLQEREMKIASLYEAQQARALDRVRQSPGSGTIAAPTPPSTHQPGKVRQMFEERRTKAGIDKSYPLQPIHNTEKTQPKKPLTNGFTKMNSKPPEKRKEDQKTTTTRTRTTVSSHSVRKQVTQSHKVEHQLTNGSGDLNHNHVTDLDVQLLPKSNGERTDHVDGADRADYLLDNETFPDALAPAHTPRSPEPNDNKPVVKKTPTTQPTRTLKSRQPPAAAPTKRITNGNTVKSEDGNARGVMQRSANPVPVRRNTVSPHSSRPNKPATRVASSPQGAASGDACATCGRHFAPDRLAKHQDICRKTHAKKRKPYDVLKHRLAGTEAEPFISKLRKPPSQSNTKGTKSLNSNWRKQHEEFIQAIRAAKQVQAHLNAGGKLSDLPPPPPSENPDYVQCPHCNRRFNQGAAERHIPKCASFQFNKPKPPARRRYKI